MADSEVSDAPEAILFANFINQHLARGTGNGGRAVKAAVFAERCQVSESRVSEWRNRKKGLPGLSSLELVEKMFFPAGEPRNTPTYREWLNVKEAVLNPGATGDYRAQQKRFTLRETWDLLMRPLASRTMPLVRSATGVEIFDGSRVRGRLLDRSFLLPMPEWFVRAIEGDRLLSDQYDMHAPMDLAGDSACGAFFDAVAVPDLRAIVAAHSDAYAKQVLAALERRPAYPPFNKKKLGLHGYQQPQRARADEGIYLDLDFYTTDYFTHRVMRRVFRELRGSHPALFRDNAAPYDALPHWRYFTTSFGINLVATTQEAQGKRFYMTRLSNRQGNANQQGLWHITANEGLSLDDVRGGEIDMRRVIDRALCEEMGIKPEERKEETYLEFAIDRMNLEPFLSCLVHLDIDRQTFYRQKQHLARDDRREFDNVCDFPFTEQAIIQLLLDEPAGTEGFTSYGLNILDSILVRRLAP